MYTAGGKPPARAICTIMVQKLTAKVDELEKRLARRQTEIRRSTTSSGIIRERGPPIWAE